MIIYKLTNLINGKIYIGQTTRNISYRFSAHVHCAKYELKTMPIALAIKKYGKENFKVEVIEQCNSKLELNNKEAYYIQHFNSLAPNGYNIKKGGQDNTISLEGRKRLSEIQKLKIKDGTSNITNRKKSLKEIEKLSKANRKTYYLISPEGEHLTIDNLKKFAEDNNLNRRSLCKVAHGQRTHHKGFRKQ